MRATMILLTLFFTLGLGGEFYHPVDVSHAKSKPDETDSSFVRIGFSPAIFGSIDKKDAEAVINLYIQEFGKALNIKTEATLYSDVESIVSDLSAKRLDMVSSSVPDYYRISSQVETELAYTNTNNGRKTKKSILLVNTQSGINGLDDLKGKRLLMGTADTIGNIFINTLILRKSNLPADQYFSSIRNISKPSKMILDLFFNKSDACLVDNWTFGTMSELNPQIKKQLKIITESPEIITSVTFFRKAFGENIKRDIKEIATVTGKSTYGEQLLMLFKSDDIAKLEASDLDSFKRLYEEYEKLTKQWETSNKAP